MDILPRITRQLFELLRAMSPVQRATFVAVPVLVLAGLTWLVAFNRPDDHQAVLFGKTFASDELAVAEKALNQAGLLNYRREDRKLLVPAAELDRYNAALVEFDAVPPDLGSQLLKQFETLGPFSTDRHRQEMKDALLLQELRRMIKAVPDVEDARVAVASSGRRVGFGQKPRVTANVTVKPRVGRELSARLIGSLRQAVASMVPDLMPADVTVFDVARGQAYTGEQTDDPLDGRLLQRVREFTRQYEQQIQKAINFIPNATVTVHVDLDNLKSSVTRREHIRMTDDWTTANRPGSVQLAGHEPGTRRGLDHLKDSRGADPFAVQGGHNDADSIHHAAGFRGSATAPTDFTREVSERELLAAMPRAVQVSVSIPRDYYRDIAARRKGQGEANNRRLDLDSIEEEVLTKVERTVGRLIPVDSPHDAISVTTVDRMPVEHAEPELTAIDQFAVLAWRHGGSCALGLFVVWALWMLSRLSAVAPATPLVLPQVEQPLPAATSLESAPFSVPSRQPVSEPVDPAMDLQHQIVGRTEGDPAARAALPNEDTERVLDEGPILHVANGRRDVATFVEPGPFNFLQDRHPDDIRHLLHDEQPQTIAVIAVQLSPALSAAVLAGLSPDRQADVLQRVARLGSTDPEILSDIASALKERLSRPRVRAGGVSQAAAVLRESSRVASRSMLATLEEHDSDLAEELRQTLFSFDDLRKLDDDTLRIVLQETDDRQWALALKASPEAVRQKVLGCLPVGVAGAFKVEMDSLGPVRLSEMTTVRQQIADSIRRLEDAGLIVLPVN